MIILGVSPTKGVGVGVGISVNVGVGVSVGDIVLVGSGVLVGLNVSVGKGVSVGIGFSRIFFLCHHHRQTPHFLHKFDLPKFLLLDLLVSHQNIL